MWVTTFQLPSLFLSSAPPPTDTPPSCARASDACLRDPNASPPEGGRGLMERVWQTATEDFAVPLSNIRALQAAHDVVHEERAHVIDAMAASEERFSDLPRDPTPVHLL